MKTDKRLGIWMDHSTAHLIRFTSDENENSVIESSFTHVAKKESFEKSENVMHNKEQHQQAEYYKKLAEAIKPYDEVLLFGPTDAKQELFNKLKADHLFEKIVIEVKQADKMNENQQSAFVRDYFSKR